MTTLITFAAAPVKFSPARLREACDTRDAVALAGLLPSTVTAIAALGRAVKAASAVEPGHRWVHAGQHGGRSRWIYCASTVSDASAQISGFSGADADDGTGVLKTDAALPAAVAAGLRAAYDVERGVVEPAKVTAAVTRLALDKIRRGQQIMPGVIVLPGDVDDAVRAALAVVADLGGVGMAHTLDDAGLQRLAAPLRRSVEDDVGDLVKQIEDLAARAKAITADPAAPAIRDGTADTIRQRLAEARERLALWRDRMGLSVASAEAALAASEGVMNDAVDAAMVALEARRAARRAGRTAEITPPTPLPVHCPDCSANGVAIPAPGVCKHAA